MKAHQLTQAVELEARRRQLVQQIADVDARRFNVRVGATDAFTGLTITDPALLEAIQPDVRAVLARQLTAVEALLQDLGVEPDNPTGDPHALP